MLREQAGELAEITVMADDAADWALSNRLDRLSAWGGAVRVYLPDAGRTDRWQYRPLIEVDPAGPGLPSGRSPHTCAEHTSDLPPSPGRASTRHDVRPGLENTRFTSHRSTALEGTDDDEEDDAAGLGPTHRLWPAP
ncbi:hypothetical protein ACFQ7G_04005 [Streptomyces massasporeus]